MKNWKNWALGAVLFAVIGALGANARHIPEFALGGGYNDTVDGGADFEKDGTINTDGDINTDGIYKVAGSQLSFSDIAGALTDADIPDDITVTSTKDIETSLDLGIGGTPAEDLHIQRAGNPAIRTERTGTTVANNASFGSLEGISNDTEATSSNLVGTQWLLADGEQTTAHPQGRWRWDIATGTAASGEAMHLDSVGLDVTGALEVGGNATIGDGSAGVDNTLTFNGETNDGVLQWMEDEDSFYVQDRISVGAAPLGRHQTYIGGAYTGDGSHTTLSALSIRTDITGHANDTGHQALFSAGQLQGASITTAGNVTNVASAILSEPAITVGAGAVTNASTLYIADAPTEATNNYALFVDAGDARFDEDVKVFGILDVQSNDVDFPGNAVLDANTGTGTFTFQGNDLLIDRDYNGGTLFVAQNTTSGTSAYAAWKTTNDTGSTWGINHSASRTLSRYGQTLGGWFEVFAQGINGIAIGTDGSTDDILFGTNNTERLRINGGGGIKSSTRFIHNVVVVSGSDTTPSVANANVVRVTNTATLTIQDFDDGTEGQIVTVVNDSGVNNLTIGHKSPDIVNNTGANLSLNDERAVTYVQIGTLWIQTDDS